MTDVNIKEADFGDNLELHIAKPKLNNDRTLMISGNFDDLSGKIKAIVERYKGTQLTESNVQYVKTLKSHFVSLRTSIDRERKEFKKVYITPASKLVDSMCDELQKIVAEGEDALGAQLDAYDQKRKDELTIVLKEYIDDSVARHNLREEYAVQIELKKNYYNVTQKEEDTVADIEAQAVELEKKQKERDFGESLIKEECSESGLLPDSYIRELEYKSASEIILEIKQDKKTKNEIDSKLASGQTVTIGEEITEELKKAVSIEKVSEENRTRVMRIVYKPENAKLIAKAMKELCVSFEFINTDF